MSNCQRRNCTNDVVPPARYCSVSCNRARWWHRKIRVEEAKKPAPPPEGCNPVQARQCQNERQVDRTRRILCRKYDTCLDHAVVQHRSESEPRKGAHEPRSGVVFLSNQRPYIALQGEVTR